ncbi:hypothetical protein K437DRAFT_257201 [Tilletiaria anomala UBC 951]|uniref:Uncharacterized protein n=1 Tax=Tilletiaria anomala (strain ATCC 24038 / CBS 436.72 / UBC 951) TaxID=1037660 RepID=A0A066VRF5_TILAU|nr:uncharacterized protein K437DRAFT_257201 [Tilletiaria anomala UBC 951]KDN44066.1 hypothetical protein K437DRAFT_257201 [Tilletiaria anomala UBC 951]
MFKVDLTSSTKQQSRKAAQERRNFQLQCHELKTRVERTLQMELQTAMDEKLVKLDALEAAFAQGKHDELQDEAPKELRNFLSGLRSHYNNECKAWIEFLDSTVEELESQCPFEYQACVAQHKPALLHRRRRRLIKDHKRDIAAQVHPHAAFAPSTSSTLMLPIENNAVCKVEGDAGPGGSAGSIAEDLLKCALRIPQA